MNLMIPSGRPIEILLVEDSADSAEMTMEALRDGRVRNRIHWVKDGEEAMAFLRRENGHAAAPRPDLVLLDLHLPCMNGHEVLAAIKQHPDWRRIPVVIMTSSDSDKDILAAYDHHANCYVTKPIDIDKFLEAIRSIEDFWLTVVRLPAA
jgi:CheY-like chemotaxis protein